MSEGRYPTWLRHPNAKPPVISNDYAAGEGPRQRVYAAVGEPAQFPPVLAVNADEEEYYVSRGYTPSVYDPEQARRAQMPAGYAYNEYPRMENGVMVHDPSKPAPSNEYPKWARRPDGAAKLVQNRAEEDEWVPPPPPPEPSEAEAEFLREIAVAEAAMAVPKGRSART